MLYFSPIIVCILHATVCFSVSSSYTHHSQPVSPLPLTNYPPGVSKVVELEKMLAAGGTPDDIRAKIAKPTDAAEEAAVEAVVETA